MGLGRFGGGVGAARWFAERDARVIVTDQADEASLAESINKLSDLQIEYDLGGHDPRLLDQADLVVVNPAVPKGQSPFFQEVQRRGVAWTTEINLFMERCPATIVGVTGSAGKSTTAAMIQACLSASPRPGKVYLGGNIGCSLLGEVESMTPGDVVVLELSSYQLDDLRRIVRRPDVGVMVSLWPQHLDRHGSFEAYRDCKFNLFRGARPGTPLVLGFDDEANVEVVEREALPCGVRIVRASDEALDVELRVPGAHNRVNACCAVATCRAMGADRDGVRRGLETFGGLPHRLEFVGTFAGVAVYNDSKATSPRAAAVGITAFERPVIALVGGRAKGTSVDPIIEAVRTNAKSVICFGSGGELVWGVMSNDAATWPAPMAQRAANLREAVRLAKQVAMAGEVLVLSPGFDSFDEFTN